jgi:polyhydroxyalkanoate synthesis regulator phasin
MSDPASNTTERTKPLRDMLDSLYRRRLTLVEEMDSLEERISHLEGALLKLEAQTDAA